MPEQYSSCIVLYLIICILVNFNIIVMLYSTYGGQEESSWADHCNLKQQYCALSGLEDSNP